MSLQHPAEWQTGQVAKAICVGAYLRSECGRFPQTNVAKQNPLLDPSAPGP